MKGIFYVVWIISMGINAQSIEDKLSNDFCDCYNEKQEILESDFDVDLFFSCYESVVTNNVDDIKRIAFKKIDTSKISHDEAYKLGYEYGKKLVSDIQEKLINECNSYYKLIPLISETMLKNMPNDKSLVKIDSLTRLIDVNNKNNVLIWERGAYKIGNKDYESARSDFNLCLEQDSSFVQARFFLAWSYQLEGNPKEAIKEYQKVLAQDSNLGPIKDICIMFVAYLRRKLLEKA